MAKNKSKTTLDTLAQMVARGFESVATKEDLKELATKKELHELEVKLEAKMDLGFDDLGKKVEKVDSRVDGVYEILARFEEGDILDLQRRIKILERAVKAMSRQIS